VKILFLSDNFPPETNAPASRIYEHARRWVQQGHIVTVITCAPNFPEGKVFKGYRNKWYSVKEVAGIRVVRVKTYIAANAGFLKRILDFMSFMVGSFCAGLFEKKPDIIVGTSPQFFTVVAAWLLSVFKRKPFVFEVRDLWPASIAAVGALRQGGILINFLERTELFLYRRAAAVITVSHSIKQDIVRRGIAANKVDVVTNGVDLDVYKPRARDADLDESLGFSGKFVVAYFGTMGMAHGLGAILGVAARLKGEPDVAFLLAGSGAEKDQLCQQIKRLDLGNVTMLSAQPKEKMPALWSLCDIALIHLKNQPLFKTVIPSKLFEAMAMGVPVLMAVPDGEATTIVRETGVGTVAIPEDTDSIAAAILKIRNHAAKRQEYRKACLKAAAVYSRTKQADAMMGVVSRVLKAQGSSSNLEPVEASLNH